MADPTAQAQNILELFNNSDWDAMSDALPSDTRYKEFGTQRSIDGAGGIIEAMQGWKTAMPDVVGTLKSRVFDFNADALTESRNYFDMLTFLRQIGAA